MLDPFAGGGAIPLEAMRLGCEATAIDINPVAWFILKCTLEYPQKLAGQKQAVARFHPPNREFMEDFFKAQGIKGAAFESSLKSSVSTRRMGDLRGPGADVACRSALRGSNPRKRTWRGTFERGDSGCWTAPARELAGFYPTYADFEPLKKSERPYESRPMQLAPLREDGTPDIDKLNAEFMAD